MNDNQIVYRQAQAADLPALAEMYGRLNNYYATVGYLLPRPENVGQVWVESFQRTLGRFSNVFVAEESGQVGGFILVRVKRLAPHMGGLLVGEISDIWVEPHLRRRHAGEQLVRLGVDWLRQQSAHSVEIQVLRDNESAWRFFEQLGFQLEFSAARLILEPE